MNEKGDIIATFIGLKKKKKTTTNYPYMGVLR